MHPSFYPDPVFGWTFYVVLLGFLAVAAYLDLGRLIIPKKLTLAMLAAGVVFSLVRGIWMGSVYAEGDEKLWGFVDSAWTGAAYGLLFALAGFAVGFAVFCGLWLMNMAGGGDVKLIAALGAWVGPKWILVLILGCAVMFVIVSTVQMARRIVKRGARRSLFEFKGSARRANEKKFKPGTQSRQRVFAYSLPAALATGLLLPVLTRNDPGPSLPQKPAATAQASTHE